YSTDRLQKPLIKDNRGHWQSVEWEVALNRVVQGLTQVLEHHQAREIGTVISPSATVEEYYLAQKLMRSFGSDNIDHRLRQQDFSDDAFSPVSPASSVGMQDISAADHILLIGSHLRKEQPLIAHRVRMASLNGAIISVVNPIDYDFAFDITTK